VVVSGAAATTAPPTAYGQNYWSWVSQYGDQVEQVQSGASMMGLNVLRAGGHNNDNNDPEPFDDAQVDLFVAYARATGAEPILQVPLLADTGGNRPTPQTAAAMVTYANVTKQYGIKYWEIGNEPDLYSDQGDLPAGYTATSYCADFAAFADAMRAVDPTIKIMGPELSYKYVAGNDWLTPFLAGCSTKVDIVSVHRYPFAAAACTIANAMNDGAQFRATVKTLRATLDGMGLSATPLAITESNFSYQGDPTLQTGVAALGTFYAGMWVADATGVALEQGLWSIAFWSLDEGFDTGFFTSDTFQPRPAAYAYELVSTHFGPSILHAVTVPVGLSAYASRDDAARKTIVLLINRTAAASSQVVGFSSLPVSVPSWALDLPAYSLTLVELPDDGSRPATWRYTKAMADESLPPQMQ
jgi:Glycosyl hydrolases family 39